MRCGDLFGPLDADERFDCMVAWPPVMPAPEDEEDDLWAMANNGGLDGSAILDRVIMGAAAHLSARGSLWIAHPWYLSLPLTRRVAENACLVARVSARATFGIGATSRARLGYLASIGVSPTRVDGELVQEFLVLEFRHRTRNRSTTLSAVAPRRN